MAEVSTGDQQLDSTDLLTRFARSRLEVPDGACVIYRGQTLSFKQVDQASDALASRLHAAGVGAGDRVALMTQNRPHFPIGALATWKLGAVYVPLSPMLKSAEVAYHLQHSEAVAIIVEEQLFEDAVRPVWSETSIRLAVLGSAADFGAEAETEAETGSGRARPLSGEGGVAKAYIVRFEDVISVPPTRPVERPPSDGSDIAILSYTSGTTGSPKGVLTSHRNVGHNTQVWITEAGLDHTDIVAALAPLFHITGPPAILGPSFALGIPMVLDARFDADRLVALLEQQRCTFALASITAYRALMIALDAQRRDLSMFDRVYSGGAPVPQSTVEEWRDRTGSYIRNCYGLTETTSPTVMVPAGRLAPVDSESGAVSVGRPISGTTVRTVDPETGADCPIGAPGELLIAGPGVFKGYWRNDEETASAFIDGYFRSGDVAVIDRAGWVYIVDRLKDMIIASGFKVWPREVEDVLHQHEAVAEAAVVGVPDDYRGETVKAFVQCRPGATTTPDELIAFCRQRLSAYKYPREVVLVDVLPQTATGKIMRRQMRAAQ